MQTRIVARNLQSPEGPVALPDGSLLIVEGGASRGCITHLLPDGTSRMIARTGRPNGLAVDSAGIIWVAESKTPSLLRVTMNGKVESVATACNGEPFLFPNDLCFGPDGGLYLTDSGVFIDEFAPGGKIRPDYLQVPMDGRVYRIDPATGTVAKIDTGIRFTNGIAFGPDNFLYVNETVTGAVYRYRRMNDGTFSQRELFGNVNAPDGPPGWRGPDGMAFGVSGELYVAVFGQRDITVLGRDGSVSRRLPTSGILPTNVAFGLPGERCLYVTEYEHGCVELLPVQEDGLPLCDGQV